MCLGCVRDGGGVGEEVEGQSVECVHNQKVWDLNVSTHLLGQLFTKPACLQGEARHCLAMYGCVAHGVVFAGREWHHWPSW